MLGPALLPCRTYSACSSRNRTTHHLITSGDTIPPLSTHEDLNISIALRKESRTCKSNYRALTSLTSHPTSNNSSTYHPISNHESYESVSPIQDLHCISTI